MKATIIHSIEFIPNIKLTKTTTREKIKQLIAEEESNLKKLLGEQVDYDKWAKSNGIIITRERIVYTSNNPFASW